MGSRCHRQVWFQLSNSYNNILLNFIFAQWIMPSYSCIFKKIHCLVSKFKKKSHILQKFVYKMEGMQEIELINKMNGAVRWSSRESCLLPSLTPWVQSPGSRRKLWLLRCHLTSTCMLWHILPHPCQYLNMIKKPHLETFLLFYLILWHSQQHRFSHCIKC